MSSKKPSSDEQVKSTTSMTAKNFCEEHAEARDTYGNVGKGSSTHHDPEQRKADAEFKAKSDLHSEQDS